MSGRSDEYRRLARECLALAYGMTTDEAPGILREMARVWSRLAEEHDAALRPVVQRQQQQLPLKDDGEPQ